jgi:hypothetical protein
MPKQTPGTSNSLEFESHVQIHTNEKAIEDLELHLLDYCIPSNFWKFYLIRTSFTLGELVFLVKVFRLFTLEWIFFWCSECGHSR